MILRSEVGTEAVGQVASLNDYVTDLSFGDAYHGVAVSYMGMASRTSDGGKTWTPLKLINTQALDITAVQSVSALTAFAYGSPQQVWKTLDGGITWSRYRPAYYDRYGAAASPNVYVNDVVPASGRHFLLGSGGAIMYTTDKATTWRFVSGDFFDRLLDASFESTSSGLVLGEKAMYYTTNGGATSAKRAARNTELVGSLDRSEQGRLARGNGRPRFGALRHGRCLPDHGRRQEFRSAEAAIIERASRRLDQRRHHRLGVRQLGRPAQDDRWRRYVEALAHRLDRRDV